MKTKAPQRFLACPHATSQCQHCEWQELQVENQLNWFLQHLLYPWNLWGTCFDQREMWQSNIVKTRVEILHAQSANDTHNKEIAENATQYQIGKHFKSHRQQVQSQSQPTVVAKKLQHLEESHEGLQTSLRNKSTMSLNLNNNEKRQSCIWIPCESWKLKNDCEKRWCCLVVPCPASAYQSLKL
jgi:hypothetical protein